MIISDRLPIAKRVLDYSCISSALYLTGCTDDFADVGSLEGEMIIDALGPSVSLPLPGYLALFIKPDTNYTISHMGIVVKRDPLLLTHSKGANFGLEEGVPISDVESGMRAIWGYEGDLSHRFLRPKHLGNLFSYRQNHATLSTEEEGISDL